MGILKYIKSLLPKFGKDRVLEDARITSEELKNVAIVSYQEAAKGLKTNSLLSDKVIGLDTVYKRIVKYDRTDNMLNSILSSLIKVSDIVSHLEDKLEKELEKDVVAEGISGKKANMLKTLETAAFISRFSIKLLDYYYVNETSVINKEKDKYIKENLSPANIDFIESKFSEFCFAIKALSVTKDQYEKLLAKIPDININSSNADALTATLGSDKLDPMGLQGFSSVSSNPIYHVALMVAEWQANRYKAARDTKRLLELRLLNMQMQQQKTPDAALEKDIEYTTNRIKNLDFKIRDMEESVNG
jgi:hypothetical protein